MSRLRRTARWLAAVAILPLAAPALLFGCIAPGEVVGSPWPAGAVEAARERFISGYAKAFPDSDPEAVRCARIVIVAHMPFANGVTSTPCLVFLAHLDSPDPEPTALWHELTHVELWLRTGDPDTDHAAGSGPWTAAHDELRHTLTHAWLLETSGSGQ